MNDIPDFADLFSGIDVNRDEEQYSERKISVTNLLNLPITVLGFRPNINTENGPKHLVRIEVENEIRVFFTGSKKIKDVLEHERVKFPFRATIRSYQIGDKRGYKFT